MPKPRGRSWQQAHRLQQVGVPFTGLNRLAHRASRPSSDTDLGTDRRPPARYDRIGNSVGNNMTGAPVPAYLNTTDVGQRTGRSPHLINTFVQIRRREPATASGWSRCRWCATWKPTAPRVVARLPPTTSACLRWYGRHSPSSRRMRAKRNNSGQIVTAGSHLVHIGHAHVAQMAATRLSL